MGRLLILVGWTGICIVLVRLIWRTHKLVELVRHNNEELHKLQKLLPPKE